MPAKRKQELLLAISIFLILTAIGFSFDGSSIYWFWTGFPIIPLLLVLFTFFAVRHWIVLALQRQRQEILKEYQGQTKTTLIDLLSPREKEVLGLIREGLSNKQIADRLYVSSATVKTHINNIYKILEVKNRREAIEQK